MAAWTAGFALATDATLKISLLIGGGAGGFAWSHVLDFMWHNASAVMLAVGAWLVPVALGALSGRLRALELRVVVVTVVGAGAVTVLAFLALRVRLNQLDALTSDDADGRYYDALLWLTVGFSALAGRLSGSSWNFGGGPDGVTVRR